MKPKIEEVAVRITQQFGSGEAMVYDLRSASGRLTLRITGSGGATDGPPTEWRIAASTNGSPDGGTPQAAIAGMNGSNLDGRDLRVNEAEERQGGGSFGGGGKRSRW